MTLIPPSSANPLDINNESAYRDWRAKKLQSRSETPADLFVDINNPWNLSAEEIQQIRERAQQTNMALFRLTSPKSFSTSGLKALGAQLGLNELDSNYYANEDAVSELRVIDKGRRGEYIPYTNRALGWHTDGYYNIPEHTIRAFMLYCESDAESGGENQLLDPELIYIMLRDANPDFITALMNEDVLTIPETIEDGQLIRPLQSSPVFSIDPRSGALLMRFTQRKKYIQWKDDTLTQEALTYLEALLDDANTPILEYRLNPGEGLICNNVLHNRSAFRDSEHMQRIMYRARYYDRIQSNRVSTLC